MLGEIRDTVDLYSALRRKVVYSFCFIVFLIHSDISVFYFLRWAVLHSHLVLSAADNLSRGLQYLIKLGSVLNEKDCKEKASSFV